MKYSINSSYKRGVSHPKSMTDNSATYIMLDYATEGIEVTMNDIEEGGGMI